MRRLLIIYITFIVLLNYGNAQPDSLIKETKIYKEIDGKELTVDVFYTQENMHKKKSPAIAFFHGGGWAFGSPSEFYGACRRYAEKGFITFSFAYRLSVNEDGTVPHPEITPVESTKDARSALRWLKENAESLKINPEKIAASGQSAGGQLALSTAMVDDVNESTDDLSIDPAPAVFLLYSSSVNTVGAWADRLLGERREEIWSISPYHNVKSELPPAIEFHGKADPTVPFWVVVLFKDRMTAAGNHFEIVPYEGREHYLGLGNDKYATYFDEEIMERTDEFLTKFGLMPKKGK